MVSRSQRHGLLANEAAAALKLTLSEFTQEVTAGTIPPAFYRDADGIEQWHCGAIGDLVAKRLGPLDLRGVVDSLQRIQDSNKGGAVMRHSTDFNADQVVAMLAPVFPGMNLDLLAMRIRAGQFPIFDYVEQGEPYWYASTAAMYMVQLGRELGLNVDGAALIEGVQGLEDGEQA